MLKLSCSMLSTLIVAITCSGTALAADPYPNRPIRIVVNTAPGGLVDITTRLLGQKMSELLKQQVIVDNRAGGDGLIGIRFVKSAAPDGYTLLASAGTMAFQMAVKQDPGYDLMKDFTGVGFMGRSPFLLVEEPNQPDRTFGDFVARAKADPSKISYASAGIGTAPHFASEILWKKTGLNIMHVPYKGNGAAMPDVMSGRVTTIFEAYGSSSGKIKAGQLRAIGVSSSVRLISLPDVPTLMEQGVPGYTYYTWFGLVAPAGTPKDIVNSLNEALRAVNASKAIKDRFRDDGIEVVDMNPEKFNQFMASEVEQVQKLVVDVGIPKQ